MRVLGVEDPYSAAVAANHSSGGTAARAGQSLWRALGWLARRLRGEVVEFVGGPARARVVGLFGAVLALASADSATVGAVAPQLEHALRIGNAKVGLLSSVALVIGAIFVIPVGLLVDRIKRIPLLSISIVLWSIASLASAFAGSYSSLLLCRLALGAVTATAGPAIASLAGDYFPASERGRIWSYILAGESVGTAAGFILSGAVASLISWRAAFVLLAIPGLFLARTLWRTVPEPRRGGQSRLAPGATDLPSAAAAEHGEPRVQPDVDAPDGQPDELARAAAERHGAQPDPRLVLTEDPQALGLVPAIRYVLSVPTNLLLIIGSSCGYFFFAGIQTFGLLFVRGHYHVDQATSELGLALLVLGSLIGTLISGQLTDLMLRRGLLTARIWVPASCYLGAVVLLFIGFVQTHFTPALWFNVGGMALVSAANPPLDAARLDVMPAGLWGRAESTRTFVRSVTQAVSPLAFGALADVVAGIAPVQTPPGTHPGLVSPSSARGLEVAFIIMLSALAAAGVCLARARHTYPTDVATAAASRQGGPPPARGVDVQQSS
jgi:MFS family permease